MPNGALSASDEGDNHVGGVAVEVLAAPVVDRGGAGFTMVVGISTFAIVTAKVAEFLVRGDPPSSEPDQPAS